MKTRVIEFRPAYGGQLMTDVSPDTAGAANYITKRDWRRELDQEIRSEGYDAFAPNPLNAAAQDLAAPEPVTLLVMVRAGNGRTAVVGGTLSKLYRFFGLDNGDYVAGDYVQDGYFADPGQWVAIGSGFSPKGRRWEAELINGYLVLNNQVDLPVTYRVQDSAVEPIWELRENGIASVGTISENNGILHCANLKQIEATKHSEIMRMIKPAVNALTAAARYDSSGNYVQATTAGRVYHWKPSNPDLTLVNGTETLTAEGDFTAQGASVTLTGRINTLVGATLTKRLTASQTGVTSSGATRAVLNNGTAGFSGNRIDATTNLFTAAHVGKKIRLQNGLTRTITALVGGDPTDKVDINGAADLAEPEMPFYLPADTNVDYLVTISDALDLEVGRVLVWDTGEVRVVKSVISSTSVEVDHDGPIPSGVFSVNNPLAYAAFDDPTYIEHFQARDLWSMPDKPRRFAAVLSGAITAGTNILVLDYPAKSLQVGMSVLVTGAGVNGGNLTAGIVFVDASSTRLVLDALASTTQTAALVQAADAVDSIVSFEDLTDDGSDILRCASIGKTFVVYKRTAIFIGLYTGSVEVPYVFEKVWPKKADEDLSKALHFRNTLTGFGLAHVYAGKNAFYRFDLVNRVPVELLAMSACQETFFRDAPLGDYLGPELISANTFYEESLEPFAIFLPPGQYLLDNADAQIFDGDNNLIAEPGTGVQLITVTVGDQYHWQQGTPGEQVPVSIRRFQAGDDVVFAANNTITREVFFWFPGSGEDKALRFDYRNNTASTTSMDASAAATVLRPTNPAEVASIEDWFVMGTSDGLVRRYGRVTGEEVASGALTATKDRDSNQVVASGRIFRAVHVGRSIVFDSGLVLAITKFIDYKTVEVLGPGRVLAPGEKFRIVNAIWHRSGAGYSSVLQGGLEAFRAPDMEKQLIDFLVTLAKASQAEMEVSIYQADNPDSSKLVTTRTIKDWKKNIVPLFASANYFSDRLTVSGINMPCRIAARGYRVAGLDSQSFSRR